jgi:hypothetical protein
MYRFRGGGCLYPRPEPIKVTPSFHKHEKAIKRLYRFSRNLVLVGFNIYFVDTSQFNLKSGTSREDLHGYLRAEKIGCSIFKLPKLLWCLWLQCLLRLLWLKMKGKIVGNKPELPCCAYIS